MKPFQSILAQYLVPSQLGAKSDYNLVTPIVDTCHFLSAELSEIT